MSYGFLHGTTVETGYGACAIERMRTGDRVLTLAGKMERIAWVGHTTLSAREVARAPGLKPVRMRQGDLWHSAPSADLIMAPEQGVVISSGPGQAASRVVLAKALPLGATRLPVLYDLRFTHLVLERDGLMLINGLWCQSLIANNVVDHARYETQAVIDRLAS